MHRRHDLILQAGLSGFQACLACGGWGVFWGSGAWSWNLFLTRNSIFWLAGNCSDWQIGHEFNNYTSAIVITVIYIYILVFMLCFYSYDLYMQPTITSSQLIYIKPHLTFFKLIYFLKTDTIAEENIFSLALENRLGYVVKIILFFLEKFYCLICR